MLCDGKMQVDLTSSGFGVVAMRSSSLQVSILVPTISATPKSYSSYTAVSNNFSRLAIIVERILSKVLSMTPVSAGMNRPPRFSLNILNLSFLSNN